MPSFETTATKISETTSEPVPVHFEPKELLGSDTEPPAAKLHVSPGKAGTRVKPTRPPPNVTKTVIACHLHKKKRNQKKKPFYSTQQLKTDRKLKRQSFSYLTENNGLKGKWLPLAVITRAVGQLNPTIHPLQQENRVWDPGGYYDHFILSFLYLNSHMLFIKDGVQYIKAII